MQRGCEPLGQGGCAAARAEDIPKKAKLYFKSNLEREDYPHHLVMSRGTSAKGLDRIAKKTQRAGSLHSPYLQRARIGKLAHHSHRINAFV